MTAAREDAAHLRGVLGDARAQLCDAERAIGLLVAAVGYLTHRREHVPHDLEAERRVLGAYVLGRLPRSLAELPLLAFASELHDLAAPLLALAELERSAPRDLVAAVRRIPREGPRRRAEIARLFTRLDVSIDGLPWPASSPTRELAEIRSRARRRAALRGAP